MTPSSSFHRAAGGKSVAGGRGTEDGERVAEGKGIAEGRSVAGRERAVGAGSIADSALRAEPIDMAGMLAGAHHPGAGAVVLFSGEVRNSNRGRAVAFLEYEVYAPLAERMVEEILAAAKEKWALHIALAQHRTGRVEVGDTAVVVITASVHRGEAYAANRYIIDRIKHEAPIWKCEHYADGSHEWGNNCNCHAVTGDPAKHIYESDH